MSTITECNEVEFKTFVYIARKLPHFHISNSLTVGSCFTLAVCRHICIFSQSVNSLFLFDSQSCFVLFRCHFFRMSVLFMYLLRFHQFSYNRVAKG